MRSMFAGLVLVLVTAVATAGVTGTSAEVIDVQSAPYSAVGDGLSDDTAAIQAALDAVPPAGATVQLPAGNYKISATLKIKSRTRFRGDGRVSRIFMADAGNVDMLENADPVQGNSHIVIEDLEFDGNKAKQTVTNSVIGIDLINVADFVVQRIYVHDCVRDGIHVSGVGSTRGRIVGNTSSHHGVKRSNGGSGVSMSSGSDILISRNTFTENTVAGVICEQNNKTDDVRRVIISDNVIRANAQGGVKSIGIRGGESEHITITGNRIVGCGEGVRIEHTRHYVVVNNRIRDSAYQGLHVSGTGSVEGTIADNQIHDDGAASDGL